MKKLTSKNTKAEMLESYNELVGKLNELQKKKDNPEEAIVKKEENRVVESADKLVELSILNPAITSQYEDLKKAIKVKENELKELFGIEKEANTLIGLLNTYKDKEIELEENFKARESKLIQALEDKREEINREIDKLNKEKVETLKTLKLQENELRNELKKERLRNEEEYKYELSRNKMKDKNDWEEEKIQREKDLAEKEALLQSKENDLDLKQEEFNKLKEQVEEIPVLIANAKNEGSLEKEKQLGREYGYKNSLAEKEREYETKALKEQVDRLKSDLDIRNKEKDILQEKLDKAYTEIREIATQTVKSSGGVKILSAEKDK